MNRRTRAAVFFFLLTTALSMPGREATAGIIGADWIARPTTTTATGTLDGVSFTVTGLTASNVGLGTGDLSGTDYSAAPLSSNQEYLPFRETSNWTATFDQPVGDLLLYTYFWRGTFTQFDDPPVNYTFDRSFTILSGLQGAIVNGNTLTLDDQHPTNSFYNGIIQFSGPLTSLSVTSDSAIDIGQGMTFATTAVPEPSSLAILGLAGMGLAMRRRRRVSN